MICQTAHILKCAITTHMLRKSTDNESKNGQKGNHSYGYRTSSLINVTKCVADDASEQAYL